MSAKDNHPVGLSIPRRTFLRRTATLAGASAGEHTIHLTVAGLGLDITYDLTVQQ